MDLISRQAILKHIEKKRQDALMMDDLYESNIIMMGMKLLEEAVRNQPSVQPEKMQLSKEDATKGTTFDCISRKDAIDVLHGYFDGMLETDTVCPADIYGLFECIPSAQPERLTDDDFETIRIHLNAYKENLGNQHRWEEAEEYQRIIDRFMAFASAQPEVLACGEGELSAQTDIIHCGDCKHRIEHKHYGDLGESAYTCEENMAGWILPDDFCSHAERRTDEA